VKGARGKKSMNWKGMSHMLGSKEISLALCGLGKPDLSAYILFFVILNG